MITFYLRSDNLVVLDNVHDAATGDDLTDLVLTATLSTEPDGEGDVLATTTMQYDAEDARYEGVFVAADLSDAQEGTRYWLDVLSSGSSVGNWNPEVRFARRGSC